MQNVLVMTAILLLFSSYEFLLRISRLLRPSRNFETNEHFFKRAAHQIFNLMGAYCRVRLEFENASGRELPERFLLVCNHQSLVDIPVLIDLFPRRMLRFVAKRELGRGFPFVSYPGARPDTAGRRLVSGYAIDPPLRPPLRARRNLSGHLSRGHAIQGRGARRLPHGGRAQDSVRDSPADGRSHRRGRLADLAGERDASQSAGHSVPRPRPFRNGRFIGEAGSP